MGSDLYMYGYPDLKENKKPVHIRLVQWYFEEGSDLNEALLFIDNEKVKIIPELLEASYFEPWAQGYMAALKEEYDYQKVELYCKEEEFYIIQSQFYDKLMYMYSELDR